MSIGALSSFKPQHVQELKEIVQLFKGCPGDLETTKLSEKIKRSHGEISPTKFYGYLHRVIYLTRARVPNSKVKSDLCVAYAKSHAYSTIPYLLADFHRPELDLAKFREMVPLLNESIVYAFRSYEKAKQKAAEGADLLVTHLTTGCQNVSCKVCEIITGLSAKLKEKREAYELIQNYVDFMLNWAERKLMAKRDKDIDPWIFGTGMIIGAVIGGYLGQKYIPASSQPDEQGDPLLLGAMTGALIGVWTLHKIKRIMTETLLLDRPQSDEKEPEWIELSERVRYRFEEISSGYLGRLFGLASFSLGEVEITFGKMDSVICLFNLSEDWRIHGKALFELRRLFWDRLTVKKTLTPVDCIYILTTLKTTIIGRGLLHVKTKGFFGPSYSRFFDEIEEYCRKEIKANPASQISVVSIEEESP